jgi:uridine nucleosidase
VKLRDEITGGDVSATHLVKGLDYKLLERVRRGEDVLNGKPKEDGEDEGEGEEDVDDELEELENKDISPVTKQKEAKHGTMAAPGLIPGQKRTRDQILAEMKAAREAAKAKAGPSLGSKFKKVGVPRETSRIERDAKGREVLITVDEHGNEKRKVRKVQMEEVEEKGKGLLMPDKDAKPLGMDVPLIPKPMVEESDEDMDIFEGAGDDYDPLAGLDDGSDSEDNGEVTDKPAPRSPKPSSETTAPHPKPSKPIFSDTLSSQTATAAPSSDPTLLSAIKKASAIASHLAAKEQSEKSAEETAREARLKKLLESSSRDDADLDMGFGSSRLADEEDFADDSKIKLSEWKGTGDGDDDEDGEGKGKKGGGRKRGPKKRKGDVNSAADVLKVMERNRAAKEQ